MTDAIKSLEELVEMEYRARASGQLRFAYLLHDKINQIGLEL